MDKNEFEEEKIRIQKAAEINGYNKVFVEKILQKHKRKKHRRTITTLKPDTEDIKRISLPFYPKITNPIKNVLQRQGFQVVHKSENTLRDLLVVNGAIFHFYAESKLFAYGLLNQSRAKLTTVQQSQNSNLD